MDHFDSASAPASDSPAHPTIAGFEQPTSGEILYGRIPLITGSPPFKRDINIVFQHYALFPHMSVRDNVGYGLRMKKCPGPKRDRVARALEMVKLEPAGPSLTAAALRAANSKRVARHARW